MTTKTSLLLPQTGFHSPGCCRLHARHAAITSAVYTLLLEAPLSRRPSAIADLPPWPDRALSLCNANDNISILVVLMYSWRVQVNTRRSHQLQDVYYGVQIAYVAIIGAQLSMIVLSIVLLIGVVKERTSLVVPWVIGFIAFMALEAVAAVYSNVLRDHVNKEFDALCKAEMAFFIARSVLNALAMYGVIKFYNLLRAGITWKRGEAIEL